MLGKCKLVTACTQANIGMETRDVPVSKIRCLEKNARHSAYSYLQPNLKRLTRPIKRESQGVARCAPFLRTHANERQWGFGAGGLTWHFRLHYFLASRIHTFDNINWIQ